MRRLLLVRHAKAERSRPGERDHERVLTERGRADAGRIGAFVASHKLEPDLTLVSTAMRTRETWALIAASFATPPPSKFDERVYGAAAEVIIAIIRETAPDVQALMVIGHNPSIHEAAATLVGTGDVDTRQRLNESFPTTALAVIEFALPDWGRLHANAGRLAHFVEPRSLVAATD